MSPIFLKPDVCEIKDYYTHNLNILGDYIKYAQNYKTKFEDYIHCIFKYCDLTYDKTKVKNYDSFVKKLTLNFILSHSEHFLMCYLYKFYKSELIQKCLENKLQKLSYVKDHALFCKKMLILYLDEYIRRNKNDYDSLLKLFSLRSLQFDPKYVFELYLSGVKINYFPEQIYMLECDSDTNLEPFINVKYLVLKRSTQIHSSVWKLNNLKKLSIRCDILQYYDFSNFSQLKNLVLNCYSNNSYKIDFSNLINLEKLEISVNILDESILSLNNLKQLKLYNSSNTFKYPNYLKELKIEELIVITNNNCVDNPVFIESLKSLKHLTIYHYFTNKHTLNFSKITTVEKLTIFNGEINTSIRFLTELKELDYFTKNSVFPKIFNCNLIEKLKLWGSKFNIPVWIDELQELKDMQINCDIIPEQLFELKKLTNLKICSEKYLTFSDQFIPFEKQPLRYHVVSGNKVGRFYKRGSVIISNYEYTDGI